MLSEKLNRLADEACQSGTFSGMVLVRRKDVNLLCRPCGYASRAWSVPNTPQTRFGHASAGKMFTAVAVLQLIEQGLIGLNQPVTDLLGIENTSIPGAVTIAHLLTHTSGIADYFDEEGEGSDAIEDVWATVPNYSLKGPGDCLPLFSHKPPIFEAGTRFSYCNAGFVLLGCVIERVTGISYFDYVRRNVFARASMDGADFIPFDAVGPDRADGHVPLIGDDGQVKSWRTNIYAVPAFGAPDGGAYTTAHDFARFLGALRENRLLSPEMTREMLTPRALSSEDAGRKFFYGYGVWVVVEGGRTVRYGHAGEDPGTSARVYHFPAHEIDLVVLGNQSECTGPLFVGLTRAILEE